MSTAIDPLRALLESIATLKGFQEAHPGQLHFSMRFEMPGFWAGEPEPSCQHAMTYAGGLWYVLIDRPTRALCGQCVVAADEVRMREHPDTCDWCSERSDHFTPVMTQVGQFIFRGDLCRSCMDKMV